MTRPYRLRGQDRTAASRSIALSPAGPSASSIDHARLTSLEGRFERLQTGWNHHIPSLLDSVTLAISEARAADRVHARIDALREDMDRLSKRLDLGLLDLKSRLTTPEASDPEPDATRIVSLAALAEALTTEFKVQFVGDDAPRPGYLIVSRGAIPSADVVAPTGDISFGRDRAKAIIVEPGYKLTDDLISAFKNWFALLAPGGRVEVHRLDVLDLVETLSTGSVTFDAARAHLATRGSVSLSGPSVEQIKDAAAAAGLQDIRVDRVAGDIGFTVHARRPASKS